VAFLDDFNSWKKQSGKNVFSSLDSSFDKKIQDRQKEIERLKKEKTQKETINTLSKSYPEVPLPVASPPKSNGFMDFQRSVYDNTLRPVQDFFNRVGGSTVNSMTLNVTKKPMQENKLLAPEIQKTLAPAQTTSEKIADVTGLLAGSMLPITGAYSTGGKLAVKGLNKVAPNAGKITQNIVRGTGAGLAYGTANEALDTALDTRQDGSQSIGERAKNIGIDTALFGAGDAAFGLIGKGIQSTKAYKNYQIAKEIDKLQPKSVQNVLNRPAFVTEGKMPIAAQTIDNSFGSEFNQAVENQYQQLKNDLKNLGGVEQGKVFRDDFGDVIGRQGRTSNNPVWYQEFYKTNGRKPIDEELRELAKEQIQSGYRDQTVNVPSWKPQAAQELDDEIRNIQQMMSETNDQAVKTSLGETLKVLQKEHDDMISTFSKQAENNFVPKEQISTGNLDIYVSKLPRREENTFKPTQREGVQGFFGTSKPLGSGSGAAGTINRNQVVKNMKNNLGVVIDTGRLNTPRALGVYKVQPEVIRSAMAEDIQTISHEIGHHLDKKFKLGQRNFAQELISMTNTASPGHLANYKPNQHLEEAIAEYVRLRLTDPQRARQLAPQFSQYFDSVLDPKTMKGFEATAKDIDTWINQGEFEQAKGLLDFTSGGEKQKFSFDKFYTDNIDDLNPLKIAEKAIKGVVGIGKDSLYKLARNSRGIAERANLAVKRGIYDDAGNKISKGLAEIVRPLEKLGVSEEDFATYLAVKHAQDLKALGKQVTFSDGQMKAVLSRLDSPELQSIQKEVVDYSNKLMDLLVDAEVISKQSVQEMRQKYPNYVPFMRYFDDDAIAGFKNGGFGAAKGFANLTNPVKRMSEEGSQRTIINPLESIVKNTFLVMNAAAKNKVGLQLVKLSQVDGAGAWVEALGPAKNIFENKGIGKEHILTVFEGGKPNLYKVRDPELYNAILSLDHESTNSLVRFLGGAAGMLRAGATLTPEFIIRNPMRDVVSATINSTQYGFNPIDFFRGLSHVLAKDKVFDQFISSGGAYSTLMSLDRDMNREALQQVFRRSIKDKTLNVITSPKELAKLIPYTIPKNIIGGLRKASEVTELATKVGAFNKTLKKTGSLEEAAFVARDLMDFNRAGSNIRQVNRAVAFFNAALQGTDRMARAFKDNPASFLTRAFTMLVLPSIGLHYWNANLPPEKKAIYDNIPQWQKDSFFIFNIPGTNEFARVPKPFELGMLFATGTERFLRWVEEKDPEAFKNYGWKVAEAMTPPTMITAVMPIVEAISNYNFFQQRDIVPLGEQRREKKDQYGVNTSLTSRLIGQGLSNIPGVNDTNFASPRIIDNTIRGYTAGLGQYAVSGLDKGIEKLGILGKATEPQKKLSEQPFIKAFTVNTAGGGQIREEFYNQWEKLDSKKASADFNQEPFYSLEYERLKSAKKSIDKLNKVYKDVQKDTLMNPVQKRDLLDKLDAQMNELARVGLGK